jgi:hypothetical protein
MKSKNGIDTFADKNSPSMVMDNTIMDNTGRGVASGSLTCSALGIGGRSDVGDLIPGSSS